MAAISILSSIGGPQTILPHVIESALSYMICYSCLGVSFYFYYWNIALSCSSLWMSSLLSSPLVFWNSKMMKITTYFWFDMTVSRNVDNDDEKNDNNNGKNNDDNSNNDSITNNDEIMDRTNNVSNIQNNNNKQHLHQQHYDHYNYSSPFDHNSEYENEYEYDYEYIPLTTSTKRERERCTNYERYSSLLDVLRSILHSEWMVKYNNSSHSIIQDSNSNRNSDTDTSNFCFNKELETLILSTDKMNEERILRIFRENTICRRLASLAARPSSSSRHVVVSSSQYSNRDHTKKNVNVDVGIPKLSSAVVPAAPSIPPLMKRLAELWPRLVEISSPSPPSILPLLSQPSLSPSQQNPSPSIKISLIIPFHNENIIHLSKRLQLTFDNCVNPQEVEVLIVVTTTNHMEEEVENNEDDEDDDDNDKDSNRSIEEEEKWKENNNNQNQYQNTRQQILKCCSHYTATTTPTTTTTKPSSSHHLNPNQSCCSRWGKIRIIPHGKGGGRGPTLNTGAKYAIGTIVTFCHADSILPVGWDDLIKLELLIGNNNKTKNNGATMAPAALCAFPFGIDIGSNNDNNTPPGINAVVQTANLRSHYFSLPYGDQSFSLLKTTFHEIGGYPDQCLMEDYDLIQFLRNKERWLNQYYLTRRKRSPKMIRIIGGIYGNPVRCSYRRWEKMGVIHVTLTNSSLVMRYNSVQNSSNNNNLSNDDSSSSSGGEGGGGDPDQLFRIYYGRDPPLRRDTVYSPWEMELQKIVRNEVDTTANKKDA